MHISKLLGLGIALSLFGNSIFSQQLKLGQNPYTVQKSAVLELNSDNQGLLLVRISDTLLINSLAPPDGMMIFFTPTKQLLIRSNGYWQSLTSTTSLANYWSISGNNNGTLKQLGNIDNYDLPLITNNVERMRISSAGDVGIGISSFDGSNPEKLLVDAGNTSSYNVISGKGTINNYLQLNIQNRSNGTTASSDVVASADNGSETANYVDLGINSSGFTNTAYPILGGINTAYLYSTGNDFAIGNAIAAKNLIFFTGGYAAANERLRIDGNGRVGIGVTAPTAMLHLKAGTATANTAPLRFTSGVLLSTAVAGAVEFLTDKYYGTITTSAVRKEFTLNDAALALSRIPVTTTNGRITTNANLVWDNTTSRMGIMQATPGAYLHLGAGTSVASTAPLKFTAGTNLTSPENGAVEFDGTHFYATINLIRYQLDQQAGTIYTGSNGITLLANDFRNNLITGLAGGQTVIGGTAAGNALTLSSTNHATKGNIILGTSAYDEANNRLGIANTTPSEALDVTGNVKFSGAFMPNNSAGTSGYLLRSNGAGTAPTWISLGLSNLSDATITTPSTGQVLTYNGTKWTNFTPVIDTSNIANFYLKVRSELSAGTGISYNNTTGVISNSGVTSVNGNTGTLTMDTGYISNFYLKSRSLLSAGSGISYNNVTGVISSTGSVTSLNGNTGALTMDTTYISNFYLKTRSLLSAGTGITYSNTTGIISNSGVTSVNGNTGALTMDTGYISNFYLKSRSLISAGTGISYNNLTGVISTSGIVTSVNGNTGAVTLDTTYISNFWQKVKAELTAGTGISYNKGTGIITNSGVLSVNGNTGALTMDTGYIANFYLKSRSLLSAGTGISYNNVTGVISTSGIVTSVNGNTGALTIDTNYISNFYLKSRSLLNAGAGISYNNATGTISNSGVTSVNGNIGALTMDTTYISNFYLKSRSLISAGTGISYNNVTGVISTSGIVTSVNGNTGALTIDTNYISNFYLKSRSLLNAGAGISYNNATGTISNSGVTSVNGNIGALTMDTTYISNFYLKSRSLISAGTGISYNNLTGVISTSGIVTSVNGNTGALTMDTTYISNFWQKVKGELTAGTGISYNKGTGIIGNGGVLSVNGNVGALTMDTSYISNFYLKTRSLLSAGTGISYNAATGVISSSLVAGDYWNLSGNTVGAVKKFGTIDNYDVPFVTNNIERMRIDNAGKVGIGTAPSALFHVKSSVTTGAALLGLFEGSQGAGSANYSYLQVANSSATNSKSALVLGGMTASKQWIVGSDAFGNNTQNFYVFDAATVATRLFIDASGNTGIGNYVFDGTNPERLLVDAGNTSSFNVISGKGIINNYLQLNIQNKSNGIAASSDLVSTADNGNESVNFVDLGINSSGYIGTGILAGANNGYLYNTGNDFIIGNATAAKNLLFFTGGTATSNERMRIDGTGKVGIGITAPNNYLEVGGTNAGTGVSGLRLTNLGTATTAAANLKVLSVNSTGDIIVTTNPAATQWAFVGNSGINPAVNFLGTTDDKQMILKSNNLSFFEFGRRQTLGLTQAYPDYDDNDEKVTYIRSALQFEAPAASFYKPKIFTDIDGNFRIKGSSAGTDYFEMGSTGTANNGGFEFIIGDDGDEPLVFKSYNYLTGMSEIMRLQSGRMAVGSNAFDATNPEKLLIDAGTTTSYNLMTGKGSIDNYLQINVQNRSSGGSASSDLVATANNGSESGNYIDMGINSGGYTNTSYPILGGANTAYLYGTGNDLVMGNATAAKNFRFFTGGTANSNERMRIDGSGRVGIGTTSPAFNLSVEESGGTVASFNRTTNDGTIVSLRQAGVEEGTISVSGTTISYNAFTGSHYAWANHAIEKGMLVTLTGDNQYFHNNNKSEIIYGIRPSATANDSKIMGSFLGLQESGKPYSVDNPNLVMAVGNGVMWVVDKGDDIAIGDYLISSDIAGHAMRENGTYPTAFVIARVAESIKWSSETATINGVKHKLISVFFESFVLNNAQKELEILKQDMKELKERMLRIENKTTAGKNQP